MQNFESMETGTREVPAVIASLNG